MVYVGRTGDRRLGIGPSEWGNPYRVGGGVTARKAVASYERYLAGSPLAARVGELRGKHLVCHCDLQDPCHADILLRLANPGLQHGTQRAPGPAIMGAAARMGGAAPPPQAQVDRSECGPASFGQHGRRQYEGTHAGPRERSRTPAADTRLARAADPPLPISDGRGSRVFVVSLFAGVVGCTVALRKAEFRVAALAFSEIAPEARKVIWGHFPRAIDLGDVSELQMARFKRLFGDYRGQFDVVLVDATLPGQALATPSSQRKGEGDTRRNTFGFVPLVLEAIAEALEGSGIGLAFVVESVRVDDHRVQLISQALAATPLQIDATSTSVADRTRLFWTNIPFRPVGDEWTEQERQATKVHLSGTPPPVEGQAPEGWEFRRNGKRLPTLTRCKARDDPPDAPPATSRTSTRRRSAGGIRTGTATPSSPTRLTA